MARKPATRRTNSLIGAVRDFLRLESTGGLLLVAAAALLLCGIGFTMSLFIGALAFEHVGQEHAASVRLGILTGSIASALAGYAVLRLLPAARK